MPYEHGPEVLVDLSDVEYGDLFYNEASERWEDVWRVSVCELSGSTTIDFDTERYDLCYQSWSTETVLVRHRIPEAPPPDRFERILTL